MRSMMLAVLVAFLAGSSLAEAGSSAIGNETPTATQAPDKAQTDTVDEAKEPEEFKIPAGYHARKRGKKMVYCKKSMESGTRFAQTRCFDEEQLRAMQLEEHENKNAIDQSRKACANPDTCGG